MGEMERNACANPYRMKHREIINVCAVCALCINQHYYNEIFRENEKR